MSLILKSLEIHINRAPSRQHIFVKQEDHGHCTFFIESHNTQAGSSKFVYNARLDCKQLLWFTYFKGILTATTLILRTY